MAQAYGSVAHPVDLGPFRRIVNVHWGSKYLVLGIGAVWTVQHVAGAPNFSVVGDPFVEPFTLHYASSIDPAAPEIVAAYAGTSGHWTSVPLGQVEASGLPSLSSVDLGAWQWTWPDAAGIKQPFNQWAPGGPATGIPEVQAPGGAGIFNQALDPSVILKGQMFLPGAPHWTLGFTDPGQWGTGATEGGPFSPAISEIQTQSFSLEGLTATYKEKTWRPVASLVSGVSTFTPGSLMVLMQKEDVTA